MNRSKVKFIESKLRPVWRSEAWFMSVHVSLREVVSLDDQQEGLSVLCVA